MEILQLKYFKKIAELQHITNAAKELNIAQPALSKTIRLLETELGVKLFDRIGKNIVINENGKILLKYANIILSSLDDVKNEIHDYNMKQSSLITLSMLAASKLLPDILTGFNHLHPDAKFAIVQHNITSSENIKYDLCINSSFDKVKNKNSIILLKEEILLALPKTHPLASKSKVCLSEVANEPFISLQKGSGLADITNNFCKLSGFEPNVIMESDNPDTIRGLINIGIGISFLPSITWKGVADSSIKLVKIADMNCYRYINLSWPENSYMSLSASDFKDYLVNYFQNYLNPKIQ